VLDAAIIFGIVLFNFHDRSELTSILTSCLTSETSVIQLKYNLGRFNNANLSLIELLEAFKTTDLTDFYAGSFAIFADLFLVYRIGIRRESA